MASNTVRSRIVGAWIFGERVKSRGRKYTVTTKLRQNPKIERMQKVCTIDRNAFCFNAKILRQEGVSTSVVESLHGDQIKVYADNHKQLNVVKGSSKHKIQQAVHSGRTFAIITKPLRGLSEAKRNL